MTQFLNYTIYQEGSIWILQRDGQTLGGYNTALDAAADLEHRYFLTERTDMETQQFFIWYLPLKEKYGQEQGLAEEEGRIL